MYVNNLSFDPAHAWFEVPGLDTARFAVEVFTTDNVYGLDPTCTTFDSGHLHATGLQSLGGQRSAFGSLDADVRRGANGAVAWSISAQSEGMIKGIKLLFRDLPADGTVGWWTPTTAAGDRLAPSPEKPVLLSYPWGYPGDSWQTPWICAGEGPGLTLSVRNDSVRAARFYAYRPHWASGTIVEIVCDASALHRTTSFDAPQIRLRECASNDAIRADFDEHLAELERTYGLTRWEDRTDTPSWAENSTWS